MLPSWTIPTSHSKAGVTDNLYIVDPSQKQPAGNDNVQNHTQVARIFLCDKTPYRREISPT